MRSERAAYSPLALTGKSRFWLLLLGLLLTGCTLMPQVYSTSQYQSISLQPGDLERDGLAILTPGTVWTRDEDKQTLALAVADTLKVDRPDIHCLGLPETLNRINLADLAGEYGHMLGEYRESGIFAKSTLQQIGKAVGTRYVAHLQLASFDQSYDTRLSAFGLRLLGTKYANARLFMQIWDTRTATIAWEGSGESNYAVDTGKEQSIAFKTILAETAHDLIAHLPSLPPNKS